VVKSNNTISKKMLYLFKKLHVSARSGHHQVSHRLRGIVTISNGGVGVEISTCHPLFTVWII
jgi:hypothetical protein